MQALAKRRQCPAGVDFHASRRRRPVARLAQSDKLTRLVSALRSSKYWPKIGAIGETPPGGLPCQRENLTPIKYALFTIFEPHALRSATFIERRGANEWGYYQTIGVGEGSDFIAVRSASPYINRLTALYRYMAGMPTDGAPAAAPN